MFAFSHLVFICLLAVTTAKNSKCLMCINDVPVLLPNEIIQSYHLGGTKIDWTCGEIDATGRAGGFTSTECGIAQDIAHACLCERHTSPPTPAPIFVAPTCKICGTNEIIQYPNKMITTMLGQNTCKDLISASREGFFPIELCAEFESYNIPQKCGCTSK